MSLPTSILSYGDCFKVMDAALEDAIGCRVKIEDYGAARFFRMRMNYARRLARAKNAEIYEEGHQMHGCSEYDSLVFRIRLDSTTADEFYWVYAERQDIVLGEIQPLSEGIGSSAEAEMPEADTGPEVVDGMQIEPIQRRV